MRIVVIGDVGGHPGQLLRALRGVGATGEPLTLPDDVVVIQVGDLVDRGPDSAGVLRVVEDILTRQPAQWVQLAGNHELQYLPGGLPFWRERLTPDDAATLRSWWDRRLLNVAAAVRTVDGTEYLLTHAGLTVGAWEALGSPESAGASAALLNERPDVVWRGCDLARAPAVDHGNGPLWAEAGWELHEPWLAYPVPFGQIHGHSSLVRYDDRSWRGPGRVQRRSTVDWAARHVRARVGGHLFIGVDPKHGVSGAPEWSPLILDGAVLAPLLPAAP